MRRNISRIVRGICELVVTDDVAERFLGVRVVRTQPGVGMEHIEEPSTFTASTAAA